MPDQFLKLEGARTLETDDYLRAQRAVFDLARLQGIGVIHGDAGLGKSHSVKSAIERLTGIPVSWFDFPGRTTPKQLVAGLLEKITNISHEGSRARLEILLLDLLSDTRRLLVIDEAQRLYDESIEHVRHLWDRPNTQFGLVLVGGNDCWSRISRYPMVWSRIHRNVAFQPLSIDEVLEHIPKFHPIYASTPLELIEAVDHEYAHGNLRDWTKFTVDAVDLVRENQLAGLNKQVIDAVYELHGRLDR
jgi:DNA transposition AAA+ family ATPase